MKKEIEAKFLDINKNEIRKNLKNLNFELVHPERLMKRRRRWARVRDEGGKITLAVKEIKVENDINGVFESEINIDSFEEGVSLLKSLGMIETSYQETYREEWSKKGEDIQITIDTWPFLNPFIEIEASTEALVRLYIEKLNLNFDEALFGGVDIVYKKVHGIEKALVSRLPRMTFDLSLEEMLGLENKLKEPVIKS